MPVETQMIQQAYRFALDPTPRQARMLASHAGGSRFAYNWGLARIIAALDAREAEKEAGGEPVTPLPSHFDLCKAWTVHKNTAVGCRHCRALLIPGKVKAAELRRGHLIQVGASYTPVVAVTARDGEITVVTGTESRTRLTFGAADAVPVQGLWVTARGAAAECDAEGAGNASHDPTIVSCSYCRQILHETSSGEWAGASGSAACPQAPRAGAAHNPSSEFMAWASENFVGTYQAALRDAAKAWQDFFDSLSGKRKGRKLGRPRFKKKGKSQASFQVHGDSLRLAGAKKITLPKLGTITVMSDDSRHPAMARSRSRAAAGTNRHMGNRRRSDHLWRHMRHSASKAAELAVLLRQARQDAGLSVGQAVAELNGEADARAMARAQALLATAETGLDTAADAEALRKARSRVQYAQAKLRKLEQQKPGEKAPRTERWSGAKLTALEKTGDAGGPEQASVICAAYELGATARLLVMDLAAQASITRATITLGADGLWWCSVGAEIPMEIRTAVNPATGEKIPEPTPRQLGAGKCGIRSWQPRHAPGIDAAEVVGVDFGVREIATVSNGTRIGNPRYLEDALAELRAAQKHLARCQPGSARREKARRRVGLIHADVARLRDASLHRATTELVRGHAVIAVEGWNVQQVMQKGSKDLPRRLRRVRNRALADTGVGMGREQIRYKGPRYGAEILATSPEAETGRTCHICRRARTTPLPPGEEMFSSDQCPHVLDRRRNTALALAGWARQELSKHGPLPRGPDKPRGGDVRPGTVRRDGQPPVKRAASTRPGRAQTGIPDG